MTTPFGEIMKSINMKTEHLDTDFIEEHYVPFSVNKSLSYFPDSLDFAVRMDECPNLPKKAQYDFYYYGLRKRNRFARWHSPQDDPENLDVVMQYYNYSKDKAKEALKLLTEDQIKELKRRLDTGGIRKKQNV